MKETHVRFMAPVVPPTIDQLMKLLGKEIRET